MPFPCSVFDERDFTSLAKPKEEYKYVSVKKSKKKQVNKEYRRKNTRASKQQHFHFFVMLVYLFSLLCVREG